MKKIVLRWSSSAHPMMESVTFIREKSFHFEMFWVRRIAMDRRNYAAVVELREIATKSGSLKSLVVSLRGLRTVTSLQ
jgi:hypothetical protein